MYSLPGLISEVDIYYHPQHDPACALRGVEFMSDFSDQYHHGLLMFDHQGSGREKTDPQELQKALNEEFTQFGLGRLCQNDHTIARA